MSARDMAGDDGCVVAHRALEEAGPAGREVGHRCGHPELEVCGVDHVDVGAEADLEAAAVGEVVQVCGLGGQPTDDFGDVDARSTGTVANPVGEQVCRDGGVADGHRVGAAVAESDDRVGVLELLIHGTLITGGVVVEGQQQECAVAEHLVVGRAPRC